MMNVLLPASAAAARVICNTEYTQSACTTHGYDVADCYSHVGKTNAVDNMQAVCPFEQICNFFPANNWSETAVILPAAQHFVAIFIPSAKIDKPLLQNGREYHFLNKPDSFSPPPIFLLNSTFLN